MEVIDLCRMIYNNVSIRDALKKDLIRCPHFPASDSVQSLELFFLKASLTTYSDIRGQKYQKTVFIFR